MEHGVVTHRCAKVRQRDNITTIHNQSHLTLAENIPCTQLDQPVNGQVIITTGIGGVALGTGAVATYTCESGYDLVGPDNMICEGSTGKWDGVIPSCKLNCFYMHVIIHEA